MKVRIRLPMAWLRSVWPRSIGNQCLLMLLSAIPAAVSALKAVIREELQLIYINGEWLYRFEKVFHLRGWWCWPCSSMHGPLALAGGRLGQAQLSRSLEGIYRNDQKLLALRAIYQSVQPQPLHQLTVVASGIKLIATRPINSSKDHLSFAFNSSSSTAS